MRSAIPGGIDEFFPEISQTPPDGWIDLGQQYDSWIVGAPLCAQAQAHSATAAYPPKQND
ncbi:hypothetical protein JOY44_22735 [Phormidium sp. CLA17]|uniref:hypothetical protein n=1 Tax=Leptolyngbya sp. Cla-17 TaxID=2803751 RepID=UPI00149137C7|nr:hypothetical protein [Leptolyngbya sp. Cla-17]MBM0744392.1 hypothetical protein [Leptolyngbya sp. Cla-17]